MEVRAHLRYLRIAPRKVRLVIGLVRGKHYDQAIDQLSVLPKGAARPVLKLLQSAAANAEHNFQLDRKTLIVKTIIANEGPKLKRYRPRAFGRAAEILKRSSHITVVLDGKALPKGKTPEAETVKPATPGPKPKSTKIAEPAVPHDHKHEHTHEPADTKAKARSGEDQIIRRQGKD